MANGCAHVATFYTIIVFCPSVTDHPSAPDVSYKVVHSYDTVFRAVILEDCRDYENTSHLSLRFLKLVIDCTPACADEPV